MREASQGAREKLSKREEHPGLCEGRKKVGSILNAVEGKKVPIESGNQEGKSSVRGLVGKVEEGLRDEEEETVWLEAGP